MDSSVDCHDCASAESRNGKDSKAQAESIGKGHSSILDEKCGLQEKEQVDKAEAVEKSNAHNIKSTSNSDSKILDEKSAFSSDCARSYLEGNDEAQSCRIADLSLKAESPQQEIILDFFAGSGTTAHAVMELNREDGGNRKCILVTNNEITSLNPNGIAKDVTTKRLKRIMTGSCYDGETNFKWREKNKPYGDGLEVLEIESISDMDLSIFDKIDERLYGRDFKDSKQDKIQWVCENFEGTCKHLEGELESSKKVDSSDIDSTKKGSK